MEETSSLLLTLTRNDNLHHITRNILSQLDVTSLKNLSYTCTQIRLYIERHELLNSRFSYNLLHRFVGWQQISRNQIVYERIPYHDPVAKRLYLCPKHPNNNDVNPHFNDHPNRMMVFDTDSMKFCDPIDIRHDGEANIEIEKYVVTGNNMVIHYNHSRFTSITVNRIDRKRRKIELKLNSDEENENTFYLVKNQPIAYKGMLQMAVPSDRTLLLYMMELRDADLKCSMALYNLQGDSPREVMKPVVGTSVKRNNIKVP